MSGLFVAAHQHQERVGKVDVDFLSSSSLMVPSMISASVCRSHHLRNRISLASAASTYDSRVWGWSLEVMSSWSVQSSRRDVGMVTMRPAPVHRDLVTRWPAAVSKLTV
jgi:hypothetical protein